MTVVATLTAGSWYLALLNGYVIGVQRSIGIGRCQELDQSLYHHLDCFRICSRNPNALSAKYFARRPDYTLLTFHLKPTRAVI